MAARSVRALQRVGWMQRRYGSGVTWNSARWAHKVRDEARPVLPDDPPIQPLPESHEAGEGFSDFSNWTDKYEDVSTVQAVTGLAAALAICFGIGVISTTRASRLDPHFVPREFPMFDRDFPALQKSEDTSQ